MFVIVDIKIHNIKQKKVKVEAIRYKQCSETSGRKFFGNFGNLS